MPVSSAVQNKMAPYKCRMMTSRFQSIKKAPPEVPVRVNKPSADTDPCRGFFHDHNQ
ncbi:Uncharacterised protein [Escherichia coli]|nr:Uncharacterised protein [Escherichia coli]CTT56073.1 Uncharacterised protein [Escherichia coli]CTT71525.1 Uncharacterised protein [Escherichia coli]CTW33541.1 Uncharacterised protein [Escherichia coli]CTW80425.1 Uncharacterised protein [Escherichia coli]